MNITPAFNRYSFIDYKGQKRSAVPYSIAEIGEAYDYEARWSKEYRNNDPSNPRIPKIGDRVRLDTECFFHPVAAGLFNGKTGVITEQKGKFFTFQCNNNTTLILPMDIQWYYD